MVRYWIRTREPGWKHRAPRQRLGALATGLVTVVVVWTKFTEGAWLVIVAIPLFVPLFLGINRHYRRFGRRLRVGVDAVRLAGSASTNQTPRGSSRSTSRPKAPFGTRGSIRMTARIRLPRSGAPHRSGDARWWDYAQEEPKLETPTTEEGRMQALLEEVWRLPRGRVRVRHGRHPGAVQEAVAALGGRPDVVQAEAPADLGAGGRRHRRACRHHAPRAEDRDTAERLSCRRVLLANVHAGAMRALTYAESLGIADVRAVSFAFDEAEADRFRSEWQRAGMTLPLDLTEAPYRDIGTPLRAYIRELTADPDTVVNVVMPEMVVRGWRGCSTTSGRSTSSGLLFERHVILRGALSALPLRGRRFRRRATAAPPESRARARPRRAGALRDRLRQRRLVDLLRARRSPPAIALGLTPLVFVISGPDLRRAPPRPTPRAPSATRRRAARRASRATRSTSSSRSGPRGRRC